MMNKKAISLFEITIILFATISFSYFVGYSENELEVQNDAIFSKIIKYIFSPMIKTVSASAYIPSGCCLETKTGAICQEMSLTDSASCADGLVGTSCETVESCQKGCCYNSGLGVCSMNSPKDKCESTGGEWNSDELCNIEECQSGCCIIGTGASLSTSRECTLLSREFNVDKNFLVLDSTGSCGAYVGLSLEGACLSDSTDFSNEKSCVYTNKGNCNGEFKQGYLCTSEELNTSCEKTKNTMCVDGKDQVYFTDSCGNRANVYDSSRYNDDSYWEKYIAPSQSCEGEGAGCGNCDYKTGSICTEYVSGKDLTKPTMGDYVCKNLNCANDRKHGESWCVYDFNPNSGIVPVGSRHYLATCLEGEISISGCADFMQEICAQSTDTSYGFTEARCLTNDWRSCLNANDADSYSEVEKECSANPQCIMFNDFYGGSLNRSDGEALTGFDTEKTNGEQGAYDELGEDQNKVLAHCVPRFTPGFQFWTSGTNIMGSDSSSSTSTASYGGSTEETSAICSLGNFVCVSQKHRDCTLGGGCGVWNDGDLNWECNSDGAHMEIKGEDLPNLLSALNERCRALGTCGVSTNFLGSTNDARPGFSVTRMKITKTGDTKEDIDISSYNLSAEYISSIKRITPTATKLSDIASTTGGLSAEDAGSAGTAGDVSANVVDLDSIADAADIGDDSNIMKDTLDILGPLTMAGMGFFGKGWLDSIHAATISTETSTVTVTNFAKLSNTPGIEVTSVSPDGNLAVVRETTINPSSSFIDGLKSAGITIAFAIIGSYIGSQIGSLISKNRGWSPGKAAQFNSLMSSVGGTIGSLTGSYVIYYSSVATAQTAVTAATAAASDAAAALATATLGGDAAAIEAAQIGVEAAQTGITSANSGLAAAEGSAVLGPVGIVVLVIMILYMIWTTFLDKFEEQEYYILQFNCESWEAPANGDCSVCNEDVRPCSEYKCKSIGSNCQYFTENGEPGYCASLSEIWSAQISPWENVLTEGNKYTSVKDSGFKIEGSTKEEVAAWQPLTFGIVTNKQAICKLDFNHSADFDQMQYTMLSAMNYETGKLDGMHHSIVLSPHVNIDDASATTVALEEGDNEYYIKCRNFAGQVNDASFVVQVKQAEGPDLMEAQILRFDPVDGSYLAKDTNVTAFSMYLNEPAECRYSVEYDEVNYEDMNNSFMCITNPSMAYYGEWPCYAVLENITSSKLDVFVKCKDQPDLEETDLIARIKNSQSKKYTLNVCQTGLEISSVSPINGEIIEINSSSNLQLQAQTSGCINSGEASCYFSVEGYGNISSEFLRTGTRLHEQPITTLGTGDKQVYINCVDSAGNKANTSANFTIYLDDEAPKITRVSKTKDSLILQTNENAECLYAFNNETIGCSFEINQTSGNYKTIHSISLSEIGRGLFYIKCIDKKGNYPIGCTGVISTI